MSISSPIPRVYNFSAGYYIVNGFRVKQKENISTPSISEYMYAYFQDNFYRANSTPMILRHSNLGEHFKINPKEDVGINTIEMSFEMIEKMQIQHVPSKEQFLMSKPNHAQKIVDLAKPNIGMN